MFACACVCVCVWPSIHRSEVYLLQQLVIERKSRLGHGMSGNVVKCTDPNQTKHFAMKVGTSPLPPALPPSCVSVCMCVQGLELTVYKSKSEKEREKKKKEGGKDGGKDKEDSPLQRIKKKCGVKDDGTCADGRGVGHGEVCRGCLSVCVYVMSAEGENNDAGDKEDKEKRKRKEQDFIASQVGTAASPAPPHTYTHTWMNGWMDGWMDTFPHRSVSFLLHVFCLVAFV